MMGFVVVWFVCIWCLYVRGWLDLRIVCCGLVDLLFGICAGLVPVVMWFFSLFWSTGVWWVWVFMFAFGFIVCV